MSLSSPKPDVPFERLCDEFESRLAQGQWPTIEGFLERIDPTNREKLFCELFHFELEYRRTQKAFIDHQNYIQRFPQYAEIIEEGLGSTAVSGASGDTTPDPAGPVGKEQVPEQISDFTLIRQLGEGKFGTVYLARDSQQNEVALKLLKKANAADKKRLNEEFKTIRSLDHTGIVRAFSMDLQGNWPYIAMEYVEGESLKALLDRHTAQGTRLPIEQAVELLSTIAQIIGYAHQQGVWHRDLKPANIMIDLQQRPRVLDFGLALREEVRRSHRGQVAGSPAYMSPEQVRGEANRIDGRSDTWALGVILYQMLTGRLPFGGVSFDEIAEEIKRADPRPPREIAPIDKTLEDICIKCLQERMAHRYRVAGDLSDDLRTWASGAEEPLSASLKIVPKGIRHFDRGDSEFFVELLPGPRDARNLPESVRFWKRRIEENNPEDAFSVGVLYGPSGCGKSSFVQAGLLPRLAGHVDAIHVEATPDETVVRLLKQLKRKFPDIPDQLSLPEQTGRLREGDWLPPGKKLLIVIDQFEQWLQKHLHQFDTQLIEALRQCDGVRLQCLVLVRDDFWTATQRFMTALDLPLLEGSNCLLMDLFDLPHARKVLKSFGEAYNFGGLSEQQQRKHLETFLDDAITDLAEEGSVMPVRLALFAEVFKGRPWSSAELKSVGGAEGVLVRFLENSFSSPRAPRAHRKHSAAALAVLEQLAEPTREGPSVKRMLSRVALQRIAKYEGQPEQFDDLIRILTNELKLVTPTDLEGAARVELPASEANHYQLTHDYLVPVIREWLENNLGKTFRGRTVLRLKERARIWFARQERIYLPSALEFLRFLLFSRHNKWQKPQRQMMRKATRYHSMRSLALLAVIALLSWVGYEGYGRYRAEQLVRDLGGASILEVASILQEISPYQRWAEPMITRQSVELENADLDGYGDKNRNFGQRLNLALALLKRDSGQLEFLCDSLYEVRRDQLNPLIDFLKPYRAELEAKLASETQAGLQSSRSIRSATALARWGEPGHLIDLLIEADSVQLRDMIESLTMHRDAAVAELKRRLAERPDLNQTTVSWPEPSQVVVERILAHNGAVHRHCAIIQTLPLAEFDELAKEMFQAGYRPVSVRPYLSAMTKRVAAAWRRDGVEWRTEHEQNANEITNLDKRLQTEGFKITDVCCDEHGEFAAVWARDRTEKETKLRLDMDYAEFSQLGDTLEREQYEIVKFFARSDRDGKPLCSAIWTSTEESAEYSATYGGYARWFGNRWPGKGQTDCQVEQLDLSRGDLFEVTKRAQARQNQLREADDPNASLELVQYLTRLGNHLQASRICSELVENNPADLKLRLTKIKTLAHATRTRCLVGLYPHWSISYQHLTDEIEQFTMRGGGPATRLLLRVRQAVARADKIDLVAAIDELEEVFRKKPTAILPRALSLAAQWLGELDPELSLKFRTRAASIVKKSRRESTLENWLSDPDYKGILLDPEIQSKLANRGLGTRYYGTWSSSSDRTSRLLMGDTTDEHVKLCRQLAESGYSPVCVTVRSVAGKTDDLTCSVWDRTIESPATHTYHPGGRSNAAIALAYLGDTQSLAQVLDDQFGLEARSEAIQRIPGSEFSAQLLVELLRKRLQSGGPVKSPLLALGSFPPEAITASGLEQDDLNRLANTTNDAGVRAAAVWLLSRWKQDTPNPAPADQAIDDNKSWYLNPIGQTMIVLSPPEKHLRGSPRHEKNRGNSEPQHWISIGRQFALSATEVTCAAFDEFINDPQVKKHYEAAPFRFSQRYAPDPHCPQISVRWLDAARFCEWLSIQSEIPQSQRCYPGIWDVDDPADYQPPDDILSRTGYRLPTEAEWEFACRGGTDLARHYGSTETLLRWYAWFLDNSNDGTHPVGELKPNDYGFFDMLGNVSEWCHNKWEPYTPPARSYVRADDGGANSSYDGSERIIRGGHFRSVPSSLRSADRSYQDPKVRNVRVGFRVARTRKPAN